MTYNSKKTIASMAAGIVLIVAYILFARSGRAPEPDNVKAWATTMLLFIGIGVVGVVIIQVLFHVGFAIGVAVKEQNRGDKEVERIIKASVVEDERDKLVGLKASRSSAICVGIGLMAALGALALGGGVVLGLHLLVGAFCLGAIVEGIWSICLYERGVHNG